MDLEEEITLTPVEELQAAVTAFTNFINSLPATALKPKAWGPREVLEHLVFWMESYVAQVDVVLDGRTPVPPRGRFDDLNRRAVVASRDVTVIALLERHQSASSRLCDVAQTANPDEITFVLKQGSAVRRSLTWYIVAEAGHIRQHRRLLKKQMTWDGRHAALALKETVHSFCRFVETLPESMLAPQKWGPREVLTHLVFWHERHLAQIVGAAENRRIELQWATVEKLNAAAIAGSQAEPIAALLKRFREANSCLCELAATLDPQDVILNMKLRYAYHTLDDALPHIERHISQHFRELEQLYRLAGEADG